MQIATYDLTNTSPSPYNAFRQAAVALGWDVWVDASDSYRYRLPNTTLVGDFGGSSAANDAFQAIKPAAERILGRPITVEKYFVADYQQGIVESDTKERQR